MKTNCYRFRSRQRVGFTFLEIILVVAIIGIMAAMVGPRLVGKSKQAKIGTTKAAMGSIRTALGSYEISAGGFPNTSEGLRALVVRPSGVKESDWTQAMDRLPHDAWGEEFIYAYPGTHGLDYDLTSKGPDRQQGTEDDINNWDDLQKDNG